MADETLKNDIHTYGLNTDTREIYLHGHYGQGEEEEPGIEFRMATTFIKNLHILQNKNNSSILIHMHTIGGDWNDGMAIYNAISLSPCHITILGYANVCSMSSIILQAADTRLFMPDTDFMVHFGEMSAEGYSPSVVSGAEYEKKLTDRMLNIYADVCTHGKFFKENYKILTREKVKRYITRKIKSRGDWYLSAEEAVDMGFADGILGQKNYEDLNTIRSA